MIDSKFVTETKTIANIFNVYFAKHCTPLKNSSVLKINQRFLSKSSLTFLDFNEEEILKIIRALNIHKAPGHYDTSIRMIKICDKSLLYKTIKVFYYPDIWKRPNTIPVHKKKRRKLVKN